MPPLDLIVACLLDSCIYLNRLKTKEKNMKSYVVIFSTIQFAGHF